MCQIIDFLVPKIQILTLNWTYKTLKKVHFDQFSSQNSSFWTQNLWNCSSKSSINVSTTQYPKGYKNLSFHLNQFQVHLRTYFGHDTFLKSKTLLTCCQKKPKMWSVSRVQVLVELFIVVFCSPLASCPLAPTLLSIERCCCCCYSNPACSSTLFYSAELQLLELHHLKRLRSRWECWGCCCCCFDRQTKELECWTATMGPPRHSGGITKKSARGLPYSFFRVNIVPRKEILPFKT